MNLKSLQDKIKKNGLDALYITKNNMFIGQDILDEENNILQLTGFSGSFAELIVTPEKSYLFTDGRYEIQAKQEVDKNKVEVFTKNGDFYDFIKKYKTDKSKAIKIGYNPWTISIEKFELLENAAIYYREKSPLNFIESNLVESIKSVKKTNVFSLDIKFSGKTKEEKIELLLNDIKAAKVDAYLVTAADSVSWLLNLRSDYLPNSPILRAYAFIDKEMNVTVFSDDFTECNKIKVLPLSEIEKEIKKYKKMKIGFDKNSPIALKSIADKYKIENYNFSDPCSYQKAIKNKTEIECMKNSHIKDGVAVTKFLYWLDKNWKNTSELDIVNKLYEYRKQQEHFFSNSFDTIAGFAENGAIVHYRPTEKTNKKLKNGSFLLLDSGGQYLDGTTDVTRTIPLGKISQELKRSYTLVLKSHIALANACFPEKTKGNAIDAIAREPLWKDGKIYNHGTGHGIGFFLNVHEGPQNISPRDASYPLLENMIVSIEPGYYEENNYGVRIENLYIIKKVTRDGVQKNMLYFEPLTMIPIDTKIVCNEMLTAEELSWLKSYNNHVYSIISSFLNENERKWLKEECN